jgi:TonB family protein
MRYAWLFSAVFLITAFARTPTESASGSQNSAAQNQSKVYRVGGDVKPPVPIDTPQPDQQAPNPKHKTRYTGTALLQLVVAEDGSVRDVRVVRGLKSDLDSKAIEAVKAWKFKPATRKGEPVAVQIMVEITFHLY